MCGNSRRDTAIMMRTLATLAGALALFARGVNTYVLKGEVASIESFHYVTRFGMLGMDKDVSGAFREDGPVTPIEELRKNGLVEFDVWFKDKHAPTLLVYNSYRSWTEAYLNKDSCSWRAEGFDVLKINLGTAVSAGGETWANESKIGLGEREQDWEGMRKSEGGDEE